jgi:hypothetical protein
MGKEWGGVELYSIHMAKEPNNISLSPEKKRPIEIKRGTAPTIDTEKRRNRRRKKANRVKTNTAGEKRIGAS